MDKTRRNQARTAFRGPARRLRGQTLIIAMIVLGLLLILGFVFLGIVDGNIKGGANARNRSQANDLAQAGISFAQQQLVYSPAGGDWRGAPTNLPSVSASFVNFTRDPDAYYLRPAALDNEAPPKPLLFPGSTTRLDLGGPDGLGPYVRINFDRGRALVRVRYAPSDANVFTSSPTGPLISPGAVHNYFIIESIGREGVVSATDPTSLIPPSAQFPNGTQFQTYTDDTQFQTALTQMSQFDSQVANSRHLLYFATTGLLDNAHFITNLYNVSRPADIGIPNPVFNGNEILTGVGATYSLTPDTIGSGVDIGQFLKYQIGTAAPIAGPSTTPVPTGFGSIRSNAAVTLHGNLSVFLNQTFGDKIAVAGAIKADPNTLLTLNESKYVPGTNSWTTNSETLDATQINSTSPTFDTAGGLMVDSLMGIDLKGFPRGVGRLVPPSILTVDPQSKTQRYLSLTRDTMGAAGALGHGNGIYVANTYDVQAPADEVGRAGVGSNESVLYDVMNPGNGSPTTGWRGPFYVPVAATVTFQPDGFIVQLDGGNNWPGQTYNTMRYRIGRFNGQQVILDTSEDPININNATGLQWGSGQAFNGTLYFEGNVRVKGSIPTDVQLTLVSGANIYIDDSIFKGVTGNDVTDSYAAGDPSFAAYGKALGRPSKSALMLMAKDYVLLNTTTFLGPSAGQTLAEVNDQQNDTGFNAIDMPANSGQMEFECQFMTDPTSGTVGNPSTQVPYAMEYKDAVTGAPMNTKLLLTHTQADGTAPAALIAMDINLGSGATVAADQYFFPGTNSPLAYPPLDNTASDYLSPLPSAQNSTSIQTYGLGKESWQRYGQFESRGFNLIYPGATSYDSATQAMSSTTGANTDPFIAYSLFAPGGNRIRLRSTSIFGVPTNDYYLARAAVAPGNVTIEASIFAEEGSFVVIPGPWFNPNPNDTRELYTGRVKALTTGGGGLSEANALAEADQERLQAFGASSEIPFYGEPLDIQVKVIGSVTENMPPPLSVQNEWNKKWSWIPVSLGGDNNSIPIQHVPAGTTLVTGSIVPNLIISYDPALATGRTDGFSGTNSTADQIRSDNFNRALPPMPRLPVSPVLTYFGDMQ